MNKFSNKKIWTTFLVIIGILLANIFLSDSYEPYSNCGEWNYETNSFQNQAQHKFLCSDTYARIRDGMDNFATISYAGPLFFLPASILDNFINPLGLILILIFNVSIIYFLSVILVKVWNGIKNIKNKFTPIK